MWAWFSFVQIYLISTWIGKSCFLSPPVTTRHFHGREQNSPDSLSLNKERRPHWSPYTFSGTSPQKFQEWPLGTAEVQCYVMMFNQPSECRNTLHWFAKNGDCGTEMLGHNMKVTQLRRSRAAIQTHICLSESLSGLKTLTVNAPNELPSSQTG